MNAKQKIATLMRAALDSVVSYEDGSAYAAVYEFDTFGRRDGRGYGAFIEALQACGFTDTGNVWIKVSHDKTKQAAFRLHDPKRGNGKGWICSVEIAPPGLLF